MTSQSSVPSGASHSASKPAPRLILASASPARKKLLEDSGIIFDIHVSDVDEDAVLASAAQRAREKSRTDLTPAEVSGILAEAKARAVADFLAAQGIVNAFVLGCDSVFEFESVAYGKPHTPEKARERIAAMSGRSGVLHTGHCLIDLRDGIGETKDKQLPAVQQVRSATVNFAPMSAAEVDAYVATGEPLHVAGSFTLDGYGAAFIQGICGESHTVIGLSVNALKEMLSQYGISISFFWKSSSD